MWRFLKCFKGSEQDSHPIRPPPSVSAAPQYQAPVVNPPPQVASVSGFGDECEERGSLLPKGTRGSAPLLPPPFIDGGSRWPDGRGHHRRGSSLGKLDVKEDLSSANAAGGAGLLGDLTDDDDDKTCSTCFEDYSNDNPKMFLQCGHHFHYPCILEWMERKDTCPICGSKIALDDA